MAVQARYLAKQAELLDSAKSGFLYAARSQPPACWTRALQTPWRGSSAG
jgi:hypothetical protein